MINLKKNRRPRSKLPRRTKKIIHTSQPRAQIRKLPVPDHMTHVVLSGHEEMGYLYIILKIIFNSIFIEKQSI